ncbi:MAG: hypothetical protein HGGPFJEG_00102 [Ignavibacteria bacterium]|nr:hypothetical protein [Ignavibacteria bacterium]
MKKISLTLLLFLISYTICSQNINTPFLSQNATAAANDFNVISAKYDNMPGQNFKAVDGVFGFMNKSYKNISVEAYQNYSLKFFGNGANDIDRVKIKLDNPAKPIDVGGNFTIEFWMKAAADSNNGVVYAQANGDGWITGNIILDRDVYGSGDYGDFGIAIGNFSGGGPNERTVCFGIDRLGTGRSIIASSNVADNSWKHIAITRSTTTGTIKIFVNGILESTDNGPSGDVSYRNNRSTSFPDSDPFLVIAAEKHDAGSAYPSFNGQIDELRISNSIRYSSNFTPSTSEFVSDANTLALFHFNEGAGDTLNDVSGASGGPSNGIVKYGGSPFGPAWIVDSPLSILVNVSVIEQGFYNNFSNSLNMKDTMFAFLRNNTSPYALIDSAKSVIDSLSFTGKFEFINALQGNYYLVVMHRNSIETWSKSPGEYFTKGVESNYDFTSSINQAYGNNLILNGTKYCIYNGDVNQDDVIDATDAGDVDNDAGAFVVGYVITDVTGDNIVDATDAALVDNNAANFVSVIRP